MAKDFTAAHPDVDGKIEVVQWDDLQQRLTTDIAGGTPPDIALIGTRWLVDFVHNDIAEPLDGYITPKFKSRFIESFMAPSTINGKVYAVASRRLRGPCINKDLLAKAGIQKPPTPGTDWSMTPRRSRRSAAATLMALRCRARKSGPTPTGTILCGPMAAS